MRRGILKVAIAVVGVALMAAGAEASSSASAAKLSPRALGPTPEIGPPVVPRHFRGDVRHIPRGNIVRREEQPEPKSPNETPGAAADPALQTGSASAPSPSPSSSFPGLDFANWGAGWPPDTNGDVGPNHYVQAVNQSYQVFEKNGNPITRPITFNSFFASLKGTPCGANENQGAESTLAWLIALFPDRRSAGGLVKTSGFRSDLRAGQQTLAGVSSNR